MGNISKLIGSIVGGVLGTLAALAIIPAEMASPENVSIIVGGIGTLVTVGGAVFTYFFPANRPST